MSAVRWKNDFLWLLFGRVSVAILFLASIKISTSVLDPSEYSLLSLLVSFQAFCGLVFVNPFGQYINRNTHAWWESRSFFVRLKGYKYYIILVASIGAFLSFSWLVLGAGIEAVSGVVAAASVMFMVLVATWSATWIPALNLLSYRTTSVVCSIISISLALFSSWALSFYWASAESWFIGQAFGMMVGALLARRILKKKGLNQKKKGIPFIGKKALVKYCLPLAISTPFIWLQISGYRVVISNYWGLMEMGALVVGIGFSSQIWSLVESLAMQMLSPLFLKRLSNEAYGNKAFSDLLNIMGPVYFLLAAMVIMFSDIIVYLFVDEKYTNVAYYLSLGAFVELTRVLTNLFSNAAQVHQCTKVLILGNLAGGIMCVLAIIVLGILAYPIEWSVWSLVFSGLCSLVLMAVRVYGVVEYMIDWRRWFLSIILLSVSAMVVFCYNPVNMMFTNYLLLVGYLLLVVVIGLLALFLLMRRNPFFHRMVSVEIK